MAYQAAALLEAVDTAVRFAEIAAAVPFAEIAAASLDPVGAVPSFHSFAAFAETAELALACQETALILVV